MGEEPIIGGEAVIARLIEPTELLALVTAFGVIVGGIGMLITGLARAQRKRRVILMTLGLNWLVVIDALIGMVTLIKMGLLHLP